MHSPVSFFRLLAREWHNIDLSALHQSRVDIFGYQTFNTANVPIPRAAEVLAAIMNQLSGRLTTTLFSHFNEERLHNERLVNEVENLRDREFRNIREQQGPPPQRPIQLGPPHLNDSDPILDVLRPPNEQQQADRQELARILQHLEAPLQPFGAQVQGQQQQAQDDEAIGHMLDQNVADVANPGKICREFSFLTISTSTFFLQNRPSLGFFL